MSLDLETESPGRSGMALYVESTRRDDAGDPGREAIPI